MSRKWLIRTITIAKIPYKKSAQAAANPVMIPMKAFRSVSLIQRNPIASPGAASEKPAIIPFTMMGLI